MRRLTILLLGLAVVMPLVTLALATIDTVSAVVVLQIVTPSLPFVMLAIVSAMRPSLDRPVIGASIGALLGLLPPFVMGWYSQQVLRPVDADIGTGILLLATPVLVILGMAVGWCIGWFTRKAA